jgi:hypothetical protein
VPQPVYPPPPGAYPPPGYPPPPGQGPRPARPAHERGSWYIGFGLGTGNGSVSGQGDTFSFRELNRGALLTSGDPANIALNFKVGATLTPRLLVGFDITAVRSQLDQGGDSAGVQVTNYDVVATWFPVERGFFARGGLGLSGLTFDSDIAGLGSGSSTYRGANLLLGVGYAFWLGRSFNLTLNLDYTAQGYGSSDVDPETSSAWLVYLGFDWY